MYRRVFRLTIDFNEIPFRPDDVQNILSGKLALRYAGREAEALKAIAQSAIKRSLAQFQQVSFQLQIFYSCTNDFVAVSFQALADYRAELVEDPIIKAHLESLYDTMLEQNLCRIIEPYSRVQVCSAQTIESNFCCQD